MSSTIAPDAPGVADTSPVPLIEVLRFIGRAKWPLLAGLALGAMLGLLAASMLTKKYRADVVLMVVTPTEARFGGLGEQLGGLASLVGMDLGGSTSKGEAVQTLRSQYLARKFIERKNLMPLLFAKRWDAQAGAWRSKDPAEQPTISLGVRKFRERVARVSEDKSAGTVLLSVTWPDREVAAAWANEFVALANEELRARAIREAQLSIDYLSAELKTTEPVELRELMHKLMYTHLRTVVLARTRADYALRAIDPAVAPDAKAYVTPRRFLLMLIGAVVGTLLALLAYAMVSVRRAAATPGAGGS